ncbi:MAG: delta-60 repeat domain-containing protein [Thermomonas sp.]
MRLHASALAVALTAFAGIAQAAPGGLDPTFGAGGRVLTDFNLSTDIANAVALQADGKIVVAGTTYTNNDFSGEDFAIARYNPDGTIDATFGTNGRVTTDFPGLAAEASAVLVQPDGKILVAGGAYPLFVFLGNMELARYNPDGSLDAGFGDGGIVTTVFPHGSYASALALQPDGKILAAGTDYVNFSSDASSDTDFAIARYEPNGSPDFSFGSGGQVATDFERLNDDAFAVLVRPDGRIVAVGSSRDPLSDYDFAAVRYMPDGQLDAAFGTRGRVSTDFGNDGFDRARSAALQPDGRIVVAGFAIRQDGSHENFAAVRYLANGALDTSFSGDGMQQVSFGSCCQFANRVLLQGDGRIVLVGYPDSESADSDFTLARLNRNGTLDATFGTGGRVRTSFGDLNGGAKDAVLQPDGRIVAVGFQAFFPTPKGVQFALARYLSR